MEQALHSQNLAGLGSAGCSAGDHCQGESHSLRACCLEESQRGGRCMWMHAAPNRIIEVAAEGLSSRIKVSFDM